MIPTDEDDLADGRHSRDVPVLGGEVGGATGVSAHALREGSWEDRDTSVPREEAVTITLNGQELMTLLASPAERRELAVGFLFGEGIIDSVAQISELEEDESGVRVGAVGVDLGLRLFERRVLGSGCGKAMGFVSALDALAAGARRLPAELPWVKASTLLAAAATTYSSGGLYRATRGTHAAGLFDRSGRLVALSEDIGRHSALDKAVGGRLLAGASLRDLFLVVTGRISSEMVAKVSKTGIPLILSKSVPTTLALEYAARMSLCVVSRPGSTKLVAYTFPEVVDPGG